MRFKWMYALSMVTSVLLSGCMGAVLKSDPSSQFVRGTLSRQEDGFWFSACGTATSMRADVTSALLQAEFDAHSVGDGWPVYVEARASMAMNPVVLQEPLVIGGSLAACEHTLPGIELRAVTAEGDVVFDLREQQVRVQYRDRLLQLGFERPEVKRLARERRWEQTMGGGGKDHRLLFSIEPQPCRTTSGAWYALSMVAEVNGTDYRGCARLGDLEHWPLRAAYVTSDSMTTRKLRLSLGRDQRFMLAEDYMNDQPIIEYPGRWSRVSADQLRLEPDDRDMQPIDFQIGADGTLALGTFHPAYGRVLTLQPSARMLRADSGELDWWD
ncbi:hypothetical protein CLV44_101208 [Marinobacterium halophilum]|uniref:Lipoprotein n=1 Tax=Marinobacterium halophilum TaxID=267374 RepID=A0A2P8F520_9GAMM|nr:hypothetical protein CLV44_101208 [Marinobacterium halophilum]